ncbi:MAG: hypothetical protein A3K03_04485 [Bdellovibrionales bacterium RIFOXYD1_FULL_44_7]|nr:MAG: hypothetical protein A3K03_04485 [Bdellovibrionales bacterium RIFOXYD1_FULL_44_7]
MPNERIKYLSIKDFVDLGFLQEANRQFFHPRGLALELKIPEDENIDPNERQGIIQIWDERDDPEGIYFGEIDLDKIKASQELYDQKSFYRKKHFGWITQPVDLKKEREKN